MTIIPHILMDHVKRWNFILHLVKRLFFLIKVIGLEYIIENARSIDISHLKKKKKKQL
jgi:hypothetical protein